MPMIGWAVDVVARVPARVQVKLLAAFLAIAMLLIMLGTVGLQVLNSVNERTEKLIGLQRKIEAYRQVQLDTISQLRTTRRCRVRFASLTSSAMTSIGCSLWQRMKSNCLASSGRTTIDLSRSSRMAWK